MYLFQVHNLKTCFPIRSGLLDRTVGHIKAVDDISFAIRPGRTMGLVGESGCGKTTVARSILRLVPATAKSVIFDKTDIFSAKGKTLRRLRKDISLIFQDPFSSLNPRLTIGSILQEPIKVHAPAAKGELTERVAALMLQVGLNPQYMVRFPHEFSAGQRQRIAIARALAAGPKMVICDEPVSALDISVQAQILNLLKDLQEQNGLTYLFITHDLAVVDFFCDIVAVMYMGKIVEQAPAQMLFKDPLHPYTQALISAIPRQKTEDRRRSTISPATRGRDPALREPCPELRLGCSFSPRCPFAKSDCLRQIPLLQEMHNQKGRFVACWKYR